MEPKKAEEKPKEEPRRRKDGTPWGARGGGCIYTVNNCKNLMLAYRDGSGRTRHESSGTSNRRKAEAILRAKLTDAARGMLGPSIAQRITVEQLVEAVFTNYKLKERRSLDKVKASWRNHLSVVFGGGFRAARVTSDDISKYVVERQADGAANASIRNELALLRRAFQLGHQSTPPKVTAVPYFPMPGKLNDNARRQFLSPEQYDALEREINKIGQLWLRAMIHTAYSLGWRIGELTAARCGWFNPLTGTLQLPPEFSKNGLAREVRTSANTRELLKACMVGKKSDDYLFSRDGSGHHCKDFRKLWRRLCVAAGIGRYICRACGATTEPNSLAGKRERRWCPGCNEVKNQYEVKYVGFVFHSFRRCAARDMLKAGVPFTAIKSVCGWQSTAMFERYAIVDSDDTGIAQDRLEKARRTEREERAKALAEAAVISKSFKTSGKPGETALPNAAPGRLVN